MTSPSLRNLRTTASSTLRRTPTSRPQQVWSLLTACAVTAGSLLTAGFCQGQDSPLDRLQQRSGGARWEALREQARSAAPTPPPRGAGLFDSDDQPQIDDEPAPDAPAEEAPAAPIEEPAAAATVRTSGERTTVRTAQASPEFAVPAPPQHRLNIDTEAPAAPVPISAFLDDVPPPAPGAFDEAQPYSPLETQSFALRPITDIQPFFDYSPTGGDPCEHLCPPPDGLCPDDPNRLCPVPVDMAMSGSAERYFPHLEYYWAASNLHHNPLYFENPALERYGHVHVHDCVEPVYSMARFSAQLVGLPYQLALDHACRRQYALGWYRPGDFAPKLVYQPPLNARAAATAAAAYTGLFLLVP
ncbi:MAG: hypothetical protein JNG89_08185 [Planctomycetaceae bacterium]|nr:hypothetical protein [Planctomycetaceae bacterium]